MKAPLGSAAQVGDRVWAYLQPDGGWFLNNAGVIAEDGTATLVDTCATNERAAHLIGTAAELAGPAARCLSTHHHGDHTFGNHLLPPTATIWSSAACRDAAEQAGLAYYEGVFEQPEWGEQTVRVADRVVPAAGVRIGRLAALPCPVPAHTRGDVVGWLPEDGVLFAGDLAFHGVAPLAMFGSVTGWLDALDWLRALDPAVIVPGHGPVMTDPAAGLAEFEGYLAAVLRIAETAVARGVPGVAAARAADLGRYASWVDAGTRLVGNVCTAIADLRGEPVPLPDILRAATADGPVRCRA